VFGAAAANPIVAKGYHEQPWQESLAAAGFLSIAVAIIARSLGSSSESAKASNAGEATNEHLSKQGGKSMSQIKERERLESSGTVLHWYDFICPFCYIGQQRNAILSRHGLRVLEMAFQAHPEIPSGGIPAGSRQGPMYAMLEREAKDAGLTLNWPPRLPNSRCALAAAEWVRQRSPTISRNSKKTYLRHISCLARMLGTPPLSTDMQAISASTL
jgi:hypothetical protein